MIHINLLPVRDIKRRNNAKKQIVLSAVSVLGVFVALTLFGFYQANSISNLQKVHDKLQQEKQQYTKILNKIKKIEENKKVLETRIDVIRQLKQSSSLTVHVMDEVANVTPPNRMWLKGLSQTGSALKVSGMALDNQTIAKYMDDLDISPYIQNISLVNSSMEKFAERDLKQFTVSCSVAVPDSEKNKENFK